MQISALPLPSVKPFSSTHQRITSIDFLRGLVMIIMALDHVRDYFHADSMLIDPANLEQTTTPLFLTRWITHFCAPVFMFLAGTSAFLVGERKSREELAGFLLKRGVWLMILELTVVNFGWFFDLHFTSIFLIVIWALGFSMVILAGLIYLPFRLLATVGLLIVAGHNLLDNVHVEGNSIGAILWAEFHERRLFMIDGHRLGTGYPLLPWLGIMITGYCFGYFYRNQSNPGTRRKQLLLIGLSACVLFILLRFINVYGDPSPWDFQSTPLFTLLSFINTTKYPPSLLYTLMTLGPAILLLALSERIKGTLSNALVTIGRVPMFFYIVHIYLIHLVAMVAAGLSGHSWSDMLLTGWTWTQPQLKGYGFSLPVTYLFWISLIAVLYPLCKWYDRYKSSHRHYWWLSYL